MAGRAVHAGDRVKTGPLTRARLELTAAGTARLDPDTTAAFDGDTFAPAVTVEAGALRVLLRRGVPGQTPPRLVVRARGNESLITSAEAREPAQVRVTREGDATELAALHAAARVTPKGGAATTLAEGERGDVGAGELTARARLIPAPAATEPAPDDRFLCPGLWLRLAWAPAEHAGGYLVEVAKDAAMDDLAWAADAAAPSALFVPAAPGTYYWRVAARDASHRAGAFGPPRALFCEADPPADLLLAPAPDAELAAPAPVTFKWEPVDGAAGYRVVVSESADLRAQGGRFRTTTDTQATLDALGPGDHFWGVYVDGTGQPLFLAPRRVHVAPGEAPEVEVKTPTRVDAWGQ